jgi:anti-sigma factor RsiW
MSDPETLPAGVHPEVELLPWYANGTLAEPDRQRVAQHLESCRDCTRELQDLTDMRRVFAELSRHEAAPSERLARSVMARVAAESGARVRPEQDTSWTTALDRWFRSLLTPQWVPTLAALLLVGQMGLLLWVTMPPGGPSEVSTRSVGPPTQAPRIAVRFQPSATEETIRSLLQRLQARVVDGPTPEGIFIISINSGDPAASLALLREQRDVVRSAELVQS